jgi:hypothetical protein
MSISESLDSIIAQLTEARADAEKCDKGKVGAPGTRVRKAATAAQEALKTLRAQVITERKAAEADRE